MSSPPIRLFGQPAMPSWATSQIGKNEMCFQLPDQAPSGAKPLVIDDLHDPTPEEAAKHVEWFHAVMDSRRKLGLRAPEVVIPARIFAYDVTGYILGRAIKR